MSLTLAFITSRKEPHVDWFLDSLNRHAPPNCDLDIIIVSGWEASGKPMVNQQYRDRGWRIRWTEPKPSIWTGPHRITRDSWWAKSSAQNTSICLCETETICFVDDRSVLSPAFLPSVEDSIAGHYAVCGNYEKRANMRVVNGEILDEGQLLGRDTRTQHETPYRVNDWYGGSGALPLEWCLAVNGFSETLCDGASAEDSVFGICLRNSGYPIAYDPRMLIIEDRTPGQIDGALKRADKGSSPNDKSHKIIEIIKDKTTSQNEFDIRNLRDRILAGEPWPAPVSSHFDWYDNQPISEMT